MGDFDAILGLHEKRGSGPSNDSFREFQLMVEACFWLEIKTRGTYFTWARRGLRSYSRS